MEDRMKKHRIIRLCLFLALLILPVGCGSKKEETPSYVGAQDLAYEIVTGSAVPYKVNEKIFKEKEQAFQFTYRDKECMYIVVGFGEQPTGGYSIRVAAVKETGDHIFIEAELIAPQPGEVVSPAPSYPYLVLKTEPREKGVQFLKTAPKE